MSWKMNEELIKIWKEIKEKFGINAFDELQDYVSKLMAKIEELEKGRDDWKEKYYELNIKFKELKNE